MGAMRLLAALALSATAAVIAPVVAGTPAHAASCSGENCVGIDPNAAGCSTTSTTSAIFQVGSAIATIENHYSQACNTNWAVAYENSAAQSAGYRIHWLYRDAATLRRQRHARRHKPHIFRLSGCIMQES